MPRFFVERTNEHTAVISGTDAHHLRTVLRLRPGDKLTVIDGAQQAFQAELTAYEGERALVRLLSPEMLAREARLDVYLVQGIAKGEKMDWIVQKAVELGVAAIIPVASRRSVLRLEGERAQKRLAHWQAIVAAACEQCGRNRLPPVAAIDKLERWLSVPAAPPVMRLMLSPDAACHFDDLPPPAAATRVEILIGAEGGLAVEEVEQALAAGFMPLRLGPRVLRTETAGLAALATIQCLWGDFRGGAKHV